jgi:hypothetical protein
MPYKPNPEARGVSRKADREGLASGVGSILDRGPDQIGDQDATGRSRTGRDTWDVDVAGSATKGDEGDGSGRL